MKLMGHLPDDTVHKLVRGNAIEMLCSTSPVSGAAWIASRRAESRAVSGDQWLIDTEYKPADRRRVGHARRRHLPDRQPGDRGGRRATRPTRRWPTPSRRRPRRPRRSRPGREPRPRSGPSVAHQGRRLARPAVRRVRPAGAGRDRARPCGSPSRCRCRRRPPGSVATPRASRRSRRSPSRRASCRRRPSDPAASWGPWPGGLRSAWSRASRPTTSR